MLVYKIMQTANMMYFCYPAFLMNSLQGLDTAEVNISSFPVGLLVFLRRGRKV